MADRCVNFTIDMTGTRMPVVAACSASGVANDWIEYPSTTSTSTSYTQPSEESDPSGSALNVDQTCCVDSSLPDADIEAVSRPLCTSGFLVAKSIHTTCVLTVKIEKYTRSGNVYRSTMSALLRQLLARSTSPCPSRAMPRAYFSVYYYTKCVFLKADCASLKSKMCNIKFLR